MIECNGRRLIVRDAGPVLVELRARPGGAPLRYDGSAVVEDDEARATVRGLLDTKLYDRIT